MTTLAPPVGEVRNVLDAARLLRELLKAADGELAAGGQWGRAEATHVGYAFGVAEFAVVITEQSCDPLAGKPLAAQPRTRTFRVRVEGIPA